jgi:hypothetical protein
MHNSQLLRIGRTFCCISLNYALYIMHFALNYSSILSPKPMRHLFTNPQLPIGDLEKRVKLMLL